MEDQEHADRLAAERIAIDVQGRMIRLIGPMDPATRRLLEGILAVEEEHTDELADLAATSGRETA